jgi:hypothetical protein
VKLVLFGFAGGQELSQHTATVPAIIQILKGDARVTLDGEERELSAGSWVYMEANLPPCHLRADGRGDVVDHADWNVSKIKLPRGLNEFTRGAPHRQCRTLPQLIR